MWFAVTSFITIYAHIFGLAHVVLQANIHKDVFQDQSIPYYIAVIVWPITIGCVAFLYTRFPTFGSAQHHTQSSTSFFDNARRRPQPHVRRNRRERDLG
jgi:hypothetical protein